MNVSYNLIQGLQTSEEQLRDRLNQIEGLLTPRAIPCEKLICDEGGTYQEDLAAAVADELALNFQKAEYASFWGDNLESHPNDDLFDVPRLDYEDMLVSDGDAIPEEYCAWSWENFRKIAAPGEEKAFDPEQRAMIADLFYCALRIYASNPWADPAGGAGAPVSRLYALYERCLPSFRGFSARPRGARPGVLERLEDVLPYTKALGDGHDGARVALRKFADVPTSMLARTGSLYALTESFRDDDTGSRPLDVAYELLRGCEVSEPDRELDANCVPWGAEDFPDVFRENREECMERLAHVFVWRSRFANADEYCRRYERFHEAWARLGLWEGGYARETFVKRMRAAFEIYVYTHELSPALSAYRQNIQALNAAIGRLTRIASAAARS